MRVSICISIILCAFIYETCCQIVYVSPNGNDYSPSGPFKSINRALQSMTSNELQVFVLPGVIDQDSDFNYSYNFTSEQRIVIEAFNSSAPSPIIQCDPDFPTRLVWATGAASVTISGLEFANCGGPYIDWVFSFSNISKVFFENSIFRDGNLTTNNDGSIIYAFAVDDFSFTNCQFTNNFATLSAMFMDSTTVFMTDCAFQQNYGEFFAGVLYLTNGDATFINVTARNNKVDYGYASVFHFGGARESVITISGCEFTGNTPGLFDYLGSVLYFAQVTAIIKDSVFYYNLGRDYPYMLNGIQGGAISHVVSSNTSTYVSVDNCQFIGNMAYFGSAIYLNLWEYPGWEIYQEFSSVITNSVFKSNIGNTTGAIHVGPDYKLNISSCSFEDNISYNFGGALFIETTAKVNIYGCNITGNTASQAGSGIWLGNGTTLYIEYSCIFNNVNGTNYYCQEDSHIIGYTHDPCNSVCDECTQCLVPPPKIVNTTTTTTTTTTTITTSTSTSTTGSNVEQIKSGTNTGAIIGGVLGSVGFLVLAGILFFLWKRSNVTKNTKNIDNRDSTVDVPLVPKSKIKGVEIKHRLGGGNYGDVYYGIWATTPVALKKLKNEEQIQEFIKEAEILKDLSHRNIVQFFGIFISNNDEKYMVSEYMNGGSLLDILHSQKDTLTTNDLLSICRDASAGMWYLHDQRIVHCDLAARNLLVSTDVKNGKYLTKVTDFGLSKIISAYQNYSKMEEGQALPIKWTAPEVLRYGKFTLAADVWSFGVVMWEIFSLGEVPYQGLNNRDVIESVRSGERMKQPLKCPDDMYVIMKECWTEEPEQRPHFRDITQRIIAMVGVEVETTETAPENSNYQTNAEVVDYDYTQVDV